MERGGKGRRQAKIEQGKKIVRLLVSAKENPSTYYNMIPCFRPHIQHIRIPAISQIRGEGSFPGLRPGLRSFSELLGKC